NLGEVGVLRQEAVARMNGVGLGQQRRAHYVREIQVALLGQRRSDTVRFIGQTDVQRVAVRFGVNRYRLDAELAAGADDTDGDLPAVRNENLMKLHDFPPEG